MTFNRKRVVLFSLVVLIGFFLVFVLMNGFLSSGSVAISGMAVVDVNYNNFADVVSKISLVDDLPKNSEVLIKFYNFDKGYRNVEKTYLIKEGVISESDLESAEVVVYLYSGYIDKLNNNNFCDVLSDAYEKKNLGIRSSLSKVKVLWKYRGMLKYRSCIF